MIDVNNLMNEVKERINVVVNESLNDLNESLEGLQSKRSEITSAIIDEAQEEDPNFDEILHLAHQGEQWNDDYSDDVEMLEELINQLENLNL